MILVNLKTSILKHIHPIGPQRCAVASFARRARDCDFLASGVGRRGNMKQFVHVLKSPKFRAVSKTQDGVLKTASWDDLTGLSKGLKILPSPLSYYVSGREYVTVTLRSFECSAPPSPSSASSVVEPSSSLRESPSLSFSSSSSSSLSESEIHEAKLSYKFKAKFWWNSIKIIQLMLLIKLSWLLQYSATIQRDSRDIP